MDCSEDGGALAPVLVRAVQVGCPYDSTYLSVPGGHTGLHSQWSVKGHLPAHGHMGSGRHMLSGQHDPQSTPQPRKAGHTYVSCMTHGGLHAVKTPGTQCISHQNHTLGGGRGLSKVRGRESHQGTRRSRAPFTWTQDGRSVGLGFLSCSAEGIASPHYLTAFSKGWMYGS